MKSAVPFAIISAFMLFDILTGWLKAVKNGSFKSAKMKQGLYSKCGNLIALVFMYGLEHSLPYLGIDTTIPLVKAVTTYIAVMETSSIFENLGVINPELGKKLSALFEDFRKE